MMLLVGNLLVSNQLGTKGVRDKLPDLELRGLFLINLFYYTYRETIPVVPHDIKS